MALNKRKLTFVHEFLADPARSAKGAAERAGYSPRNAKRAGYLMIRDPEVKALIDHKMEGLFKKLDVTSESVISDIIEARERAIEAGNVAWAVAARLKCDELLGKHLGMFKDRVEIGVDEALVERLEAGRRRSGLASATELPALPEITASISVGAVIAGEEADGGRSTETPTDALAAAASPAPRAERPVKTIAGQRRVKTLEERQAEMKEHPGAPLLANRRESRE